MKKDKTKILILDNSPGVTGALRSIVAVSKRLTDKFDFIFVIPSKKIVTKLEQEGTKVKYVPFLEIQKNWSLLLYIPQLIINTFRLQKIIKQNRVKVIHVNDIYNMCGVLLKIFKPSLCVVYHIRLLPGSYANVLYKFWVKLIAKYADKIICVSNAVYNSLPQTSKKEIIYDALPEMTYDQVVAKDEAFTYLYVANYIPGKGQEYAIDAFAKIHFELEDVRLRFIGGDLNKKKNKQHKKELQKRVRQLGLDNHINFLGEQSDRQLGAHYRSADVVINFSESESFSMVCLEALMAGTPVVATKCGGPEEIIEHNVNGLLVENKNIAEMIVAMKLAYEDKRTLRQLTINTKPSVVDKYSISVSSQQLERVYNKMMEIVR